MTQKLDWRLARLDELTDSVKKANVLAGDFRALSEEFAAIAEELELGGEGKPYDSTEKANQIRALLAERNRVVKTIKEAIEDLRSELKSAGVIG